MELLVTKKVYDFYPMHGIMIVMRFPVLVTLLGEVPGGGVIRFSETLEYEAM